MSPTNIAYSSCTDHFDLDIRVDHGPAGIGEAKVSDPWFSCVIPGTCGWSYACG